MYFTDVHTEELYVVEGAFYMKQEDNEFMQHELRLPELTVRGMLLGAILTVIFTASNVYLGLKVGLTFSSAIPAAVTPAVAIPAAAIPAATWPTPPTPS